MTVSDDSINRQKIRLWTHRLIEEYRHIQFTYNLKTKIPVIQIENTSVRWGAWDSVTRTLSISQRLIEMYPWETVLEIFKHEIAHQLITDEGQEQTIHGPAFKAACERLGVASWACRAETKEIPKESPLRAGEISSEEKRLLERAEKLLSLATSDNEHEALLAMQRVQELYAKYNLKRIQEKKEAHWGYLLLKLKKKRIERYQSVIASILNEHFFVEVIHTSLYDPESCSDFKVLELLGTRENVLMAEYVFYFLENQLAGLWKAYQPNKSLGIATRNSFYLGVLEGFREKLNKLELPTDNSVSLILRQDEGLRNLVKGRYPKLNRLRGSRRLHDNQAYSAGKREGRSLVIRKGISKTDGYLKKLLRS
ncbi:MAG: DUF2786 domain-containing protein [Proteobacteria bacterium]|nr:DUF2786 domain-containing protein [Pseudomonadota bacterium]